jgi:DNA-binding HxlR family transcriptional regulator
MDDLSGNIGQDRAEAVRDSIDLISKKWHAQILYSLESDFTKFSDLKSDLDGISGKVLSESLSDLVEKDLVRKSSAGYALTQEGRGMKSALDSIADWGERYAVCSDRTVLVVEDEDAQRKMYARWLENYTVKTVSTEAEAYDELDDETDLVLLDRIFDKPKGEDIAERMKQMFSDIEIVMITAVSPDIDIVDMEVDDYLVKPVERGELNSAVERALTRSSETAKKRKLLSLAAKKAVLDRNSAAEDLDRYNDLSERIESMKEEVDAGKELLDNLGIIR